MTRPLAAVLVVWACAVAVGIVLMTRFDSAEGPTTNAPSSWPRASSIIPARFGATVVMFVHPDCPCTRASRAELAEIASTAPPTTEFIVTSDLAEARRFGAQTSGDVVVYDATGVLRFQGGITISRGHVGHNLGHVRVDAIVHGVTGGVAQTPVFGCALEAAS
jgi:hypothetical protein